MMGVLESTKILTYEFPDDESKIAKVYHGSNWPVVYLIHNDYEIYVGETTSACVRFRQHADPNGSYYSDRSRLRKMTIIFNDYFNKSAVLDIEQNLIQLIEADNAIQRSNNQQHYTLQNRNGGQSDQHDYYNRIVYHALLEDLWKSLVKRRLAYNDFQSIRNSDLFKYSPYNSLTPEQKTASRDILSDMISCLKKGVNGTAILKGSAGTGKSIVLIHMISMLLRAGRANHNYDAGSADSAELDDDHILYSELDSFVSHRKLKVGFVVPMSSIRSTFAGVFKYMDGLRANMVIGPNDVLNDDYDIVFVDEAHRLKRRKSLGTEYGSFDRCCERLSLNPEEATQLDFILSRTKYQVMVYDEAQSVKSSDIPDSVFRSKLPEHTIERELTSQMRCRGGSDFLQYIDDIFNVSAQENKVVENYEFKMFDDPNQMIDFIIASDNKEKLCRVVAGYSWKWVSKDKPGESLKTVAEKKVAGKEADIVFGDRKYYWNVNSTRWILNSSPEEIGCIHTTQGYDLNRVGVILGHEIDFDPVHKTITIDKSHFYDKNVMMGVDDETLKKYIINAYKVMMVRGIRGCYIYACNPNLREYLRQFTSQDFT